MPRRGGRLLKSSRKLGSSPRITIRARKLRPPARPDSLSPVTLRMSDSGVPMNEPETRIANALDELRIRFQSQVNILGGSVMGGARLDFLLTDYQVDIEYQGPFHGTTYGLGRDVLRNAGVRSQGIRVEFLYERDLPRLKPRILEITGIPLGRAQ